MSLSTAMKSVASKVGILSAILGIRVSAIWRSFDRKDVFVFTGLSMLWHGLYLQSPSLAYSVCGGIILAIGLVGSVFGGAK
jgi:hypothetical protein